MVENRLTLFFLHLKLQSQNYYKSLLHLDEADFAYPQVKEKKKPEYINRLYKMLQYPAITLDLGAFTFSASYYSQMDSTEMLFTSFF
jgi:hypothetical protein